MIDIRDISLLSLLPESIASDPNVRALALALDPQLREVAAAIVEAVILPNIDNLDDPVLDEIAWGFKLNELQLWDTATTQAKRNLLKNIFAIMKKSGTRFAVRRIFDVMSVVGTVIEWWEEQPTAEANTYRLRLFVDQVGISLLQLLQIGELVRRFARASQKLRELAIESNRTAALAFGLAPVTGRYTTLAFEEP